MYQYFTQVGTLALKQEFSTVGVHGLPEIVCKMLRLSMSICVFQGVCGGEVLWLSSDSQGLNRVKGPLPKDTTAAAALPAPPALPCGRPLDLPLLNAVSFLQSLEAVLCAYLKTLSTLTKLRHFFPLYNLPML